MSMLYTARNRTAEEDGQTFVEYALILAAVVVGVLLTVTWTGLQDVLQAAMDAVAGAV
jgi:Flp pilus assembly pilin Flp